MISVVMVSGPLGTPAEPAGGAGAAVVWAASSELDSAARTGQTVVYRAMVSVVTVGRNGQLVTSGAH